MRVFFLLRWQCLFRGDRVKYSLIYLPPVLRCHRPVIYVRPRARSPGLTAAAVNGAKNKNSDPYPAWPHSERHLVAARGQQNT